jgi:hypothetical protein
VLEPHASGLFEAVHIFLEKQHTIFMTFIGGKKFFVSNREVKVYLSFDVSLRISEDEIDLPCPQVLRDG